MATKATTSAQKADTTNAEPVAETRSATTDLTQQAQSATTAWRKAEQTVNDATAGSA